MHQRIKLKSVYHFTQPHTHTFGIFFKNDIIFILIYNSSHKEQYKIQGEKSSRFEEMLQFIVKK